MKQRIVWIDFAKAFAIFCVVFGHIEVFSMDHYSGFFYELQRSFCMPLFFFISGMLAKPQMSLSDSLGCIKKKFLQLIVPFVLCGSVYLYICYPHLPWWSLFYYPEGEAHMGYWFLLVLFELNLLFAIGQFITRICHCKRMDGRGFLFTSIVLWLFLFMILMSGYLGLFPKEPLYTVISFQRIFSNFPFFIGGYLMARNHKYMEYIFHSKSFCLFSLSFILLFLLSYRYSVSSLPLSLFMAFSAVCSLLFLFKNSQHQVTWNFFWGGYFERILSYIGKHTLEIYVLHYFFLPLNINWLVEVIAPNGVVDSNITLELLICSVLALVVIFVTLVFAWILRQNILTTRLLLGVTK